MIGLGWFASLTVNSLLGLLFVLAEQTTSYALLLVPVPLVVLHLAYQGYAAARLDRSRLAGIHAAAQVLSDPSNPRSAIAPFLRAAAEVFETQSSALVLKSERGWEIHRLDRELGEVDVSVEPEDTASLEAALTAQLGPVRIRASEKGPLAAALRGAGHRDCLAAPLLDGGKVLGALVLLDQAGMEGAPEGQLAVLEALAREVGGAFTKGWLLDSVFEERRKLATVVGATSDGIASIAEDGVVRSWNPALESITGLSERLVVGRPEALMRLDARTVEGVPVDLSDWASGAQLPQELSVKAQSMGRRRLSCSYSTAEDMDGRTLVIVARDVTPAQEFEALRAEFGRLVEQEAARRLVVEQLQAAVVPDTPAVPGLELAVAYVASDPKEPTGGDLWDWHVMADGQLHIAVVDVLGHGVAATKSALSVVHTLRAVALDGTPLEDMVGRASALLERQDADLVATVVLARLDPATGRLRLASGGHPPALIVSSTGGVRVAGASGGAIGWPGAGSDGVEELYLAAGDTLAALHRRAGRGPQGHHRGPRQPGTGDGLGRPPPRGGARRRAGRAGPRRSRAEGRHAGAGRPPYQRCWCCGGARGGDRAMAAAAGAASRAARPARGGPVVGRPRCGRRRRGSGGRGAAGQCGARCARAGGARGLRRRWPGEHRGQRRRARAGRAAGGHAAPAGRRGQPRACSSCASSARGCSWTRTPSGRR